MSAETLAWLNDNTLIGFTDKRGRAWHWRRGSNNHYPGPVPIEDVESRLFDWEAKPLPAMVPWHTGEWTATNKITGEEITLATVPDTKAVAHGRTGDVFGWFKDGYQPHQYREWLLERTSNLLDSGLTIGSAGLLRGGAQAWVSVEVPENITTPQGVEFRPNLLAVTSFDGTLSTTYKRVVTNVVCDNTMSAGLAEHGQQTKVKHTRHSTLKIADAREALAILHTDSDEFAAEVKQLCETDVNDQQWQDFLDAHKPLPAERGISFTKAHNEREQLRNLWDNDARVCPWRNTAWGVVQAVNTRANHLATVRNVSRPERNMTRAVNGDIDTLDRNTVATLQAVLA